MKRSLIRNILGLWLIQESPPPVIQREGADVSAMATWSGWRWRAKPFASASSTRTTRCFVPAGQPAPPSAGILPEEPASRSPKPVGEVMRCIYESLAMKYRYTYRAS